MTLLFRRHAFLFLGTILLAQVANAVCDCTKLSPDEQKDQATYVFAGTVYDLKKTAGAAVFDVDDVFKGEPHSEVEVVDAGVGTDCALNLKEGDSYMVYGHWEWGSVSISSCTGTTPATAARPNTSARAKRRVKRKDVQRAVGKLSW